MAAVFSYQGYDYALVAPDDPEMKFFIGYRVGMEPLGDGTYTPGEFVRGSNNGWQGLGSHGPILVYARPTPKSG